MVKRNDLRIELPVYQPPSIPTLQDFINLAPPPTPQPPKMPCMPSFSPVYHLQKKKRQGSTVAQTLAKHSKSGQRAELKCKRPREHHHSDSDLKTAMTEEDLLCHEDFMDCVFP